MKLLIVGEHGLNACDWSGYALLRDNVQHYVEGGEPSDRFRALHELEQAIDRGTVRVDAARLRGEVLRARTALSRVPLEQAAVSLRTRAVLTGCASRPSARDTVLAWAAGWELPVEAAAGSSVAQAAAGFIELVLANTTRAVDGDLIEVRRDDGRPRYAPRNAGARKPSRKPPRRGMTLASPGQRLPPPLPPRREPVPPPLPQGNGEGVS